MVAVDEKENELSVELEPIEDVLERLCEVVLSPFFKIVSMVAKISGLVVGDLVRLNVQLCLPF